MLRKYCEAKDRVTLKNALETKQKKAEKTLNKIMKEKSKKVAESLEKSNAAIARMTFRSRRENQEAANRFADYDDKVEK